MKKRQAALYSFFIIGGFFMFGGGSAYAEAPGVVIQDIKVSTKPHVVKFEWHTDVPSDSWVVVDPVTHEQYFYFDTHDGVLKEKTRELSGRGHWANFSLPNNSMLGRCDGGGAVTEHCVELLVEFQDTLHRYQLYSCGLDQENNLRCDTSKILEFQSAKDVAAPSTPKGFRVLYSGRTSNMLVWTRSTDDDTRWYPGYKIYRNGTLIKTYSPANWRPSNWTREVYDKNRSIDQKLFKVEYYDTKLEDDTSYLYYVVAFDRAGNESGKTPNVKAETLGDGDKPKLPDKKVPPTQPHSISSSVAPVPCCTAVISWEASSDPEGKKEGIKHYEVFRADKVLGTTKARSYKDTNIKQGVSYSYYVRAIDKDGNASLPSLKTTVSLGEATEPVVQSQTAQKTTFQSTQTQEKAPETKPSSPSQSAAAPTSTLQSLSSEKSDIIYLGLRSGRLEFVYTIVPDEGSTVDPNETPRCYGRTHRYVKEKKDFIDEINGEFSGLQSLAKGDAQHQWKVSALVTIQPTLMRYTLKCSLLSRMVEVRPSDWGSDQQAHTIASLDKKSPSKKKTASKTAKIPKGVDTTVKTTIQSGEKKEIIDVYSIDVPASAAFNPRPGDKNAIVGLADFIVYEPIRINRITLTIRDHKNIPFERIYLELNGKPVDAQFDTYDVKTKEITFSGFRDIAVIEKMERGKHRFAIRADVRNPGKLNIITDHFAITDIQALTGSGVKARMKGAVNLKAYTVRKRAPKPGTSGGAYETFGNEL